VFDFDLAEEAALPAAKGAGLLPGFDGGNCCMNKTSASPGFTNFLGSKNPGTNPADVNLLADRNKAGELFENGGALTVKSATLNFSPCARSSATYLSNAFWLRRR
jgi:hypothetical protein